MLECYYDILYKDRFEELFGKYYIGKNPTPLAHSYRVLLFDFSGVDTTNLASIYQEFCKSVRFSVDNFLVLHKLGSEKERQEVLNETSPQLIIKSLFRLYRNLQLPERLFYLLIDEYDHFTHEILIQDLDAFQKIISVSGYVRKFYKVVKSATRQGVVDKIFITGVSPITLDSLASGFNILKRLTHRPGYEAMMGFSKGEVRSLARLALQDPSREEKIMQDLRYYYNGYKFSPSANKSLYNPDMVLYFLDEFQATQTYPRQMLDPNLMHDYQKLKKMFELARWQENIAVLETVLTQKTIAGDLVAQFSFEKPFTENDFVNLLYYFGNLTIETRNEAGEIIFRIPNRVIEELYWQYYAYFLQTYSDLPQGEDKVRKAVAELTRGNWVSFFAQVEELLKALCNRDFRKFDEKYIKMLIMAYAIQGKYFWVQSEREVKGGGYIDLELYIRLNNPARHHQFALEIKYLKKEEEAEKDRIIQEAKAQLLKYYQNDEVLQSKSQLHLLAAVVVKDRVFVEEAPLPELRL
jgi:chorismate mutase